MGDKRLQRASRQIEFQKAFWAVANQEPSISDCFETQRPPAGVGDRTDPPSGATARMRPSDSPHR
jgi:hypothetical protein